MRVAGRGIVCYNSLVSIGEVPEWLNGAVSKTVVGLVPTVGSNPTLSAERKVCAKSLISPGPTGSRSVEKRM